MTTPDPSLSTSADVEAVASALLASRLTWGVHADRWADQEWQREFWTEAATIAVAALSTPPTEDAEGVVHVTADTLDQWTEDALTQGIAPTNYVWGVLNAALADQTEATL